MTGDAPDPCPPLAPLPEGRLPRSVGREEFLAGLEAHARWVRTGGREGARLDLTGRRLPAGEALPGANLRRAVLAGVEWRGADLTGADLRGADLAGAVLHELNLTGARLDAPDTRLDRAALHGVRLAGADLSGASLDGVRAAHGDWTGARLDRARLDGGRFEHVRMPDLYLYGASLRGAVLRQIDLTGARLLGADLTGADLWRARLADADLREVTGLVPDETYIARARFSPAPGLRVPRPAFLRARRGAAWRPGRDPWSLLRQTYAGPRAVFLILGLACFAVPYVARLVGLVELSHAQRAAVQMAEAHEVPLPGGPAPGGSRPRPPDPAAPHEDVVARRVAARFERESVPVWWALLGLDRGHWWEPTRAVLLVAYNLCVFWLVRRVGPMRDEEVRSGYSPGWTEYRRLVRLHGVCSALLYVSLASFAWNMHDLLTDPVWPLRPTPPASTG